MTHEMTSSENHIFDAEIAPLSETPISDTDKPLEAAIQAFRNEHAIACPEEKN